jgi:aspartyl-tRNA(Asn)/glutamyl-tRNA(Gln) amidotransferase subunit C
MDVEEIASISRIALDEGERKKFGEQMEAVLAYVRRLEEVDVEGVEPATHAVAVENVWGEDVVQRGIPGEEILRNAPAVRDGQIAVPRVVEGP